MKVVNAIRSMRVDQAGELEGLDAPEFGMEAYSEGDVVATQ
jgi:ammonia channel protein AmtB